LFKYQVFGIILEKMEVKLYESTGKFVKIEEMKKLAQVAARICYSEKDVEGLSDESYKPELVEGRLLGGGHHSPFEHTNLTFYFNGMPKALAMVFNNERQYATSEKSARYTVMKDMAPEQKAIYDKWMEKLIPRISSEYPEMDNTLARIEAIRKLAQENARYMTSVFTPTKMLHTINLRQLNFLLNEFGEYVKAKSSSEKPFERKLSGAMQNFLEQTLELNIDGLKNQTDRHLSMFDFEESSHIFADVYSTQYFMSFAGLGQAQRHRTILYNAQTPELGAPLGFYTPQLVENWDLGDEWIADLEKIAETDFPQAQMLLVRERGNLEDFRSKCMLRLCGHAQHEIMRNTRETAEEYAKHVPKVKKWIAAKCMQGFPCKSPCMWKGRRALERIV
jgi:thymidylate synthase ThyX